MYIADLAVRCPNCDLVFTTRQTPIIIDTGYRNSELRQDFQGRQIQYEPFAVATCPACAYVNWTNQFPLVDAQTEIRQADMPSYVQFRNLAMETERQGKNFYQVGMFYLMAAWCADDALATSQATENRMLAADAFRKALIDGSCPVSERPNIEYLLGELLRRAGQFQASIDYFRQVIGRLPSNFAMIARKLTKLAEAGQSEAIDFIGSLEDASSNYPPGLNTPG